MVLSLIDHTRKGCRRHNVVIVKSDKDGYRAQSLCNPGQFDSVLLVRQVPSQHDQVLAINLGYGEPAEPPFPSMSRAS
jgi:hypothetical protein